MIPLFIWYEYTITYTWSWRFKFDKKLNLPVDNIIREFRTDVKKNNILNTELYNIIVLS